MVGAESCISRNTMAFLALSLIRDAQSVSVVRTGYRASLHSPADTQVKNTHTSFGFNPSSSTYDRMICSETIVLTWGLLFYLWADICETERA